MLISLSFAVEHSDSFCKCNYLQNTFHCSLFKESKVVTVTPRVTAQCIDHPNSQINTVVASAAVTLNVVVLVSGKSHSSNSRSQIWCVHALFCTCHVHGPFIRHLALHLVVRLSLLHLSDLRRTELHDVGAGSST